MDAEPATGAGPARGGDPSTPAAPVVCYRHPRREAGVRCVRCDRPICPECMRPAAVGFQCPECVAAGSRTVRPARTVYGGRPTRRGPVVTGALVAANIVMFIVTAIGGTSLGFSGGTSSLFNSLALRPVNVAASGEYYRLLSAMFLHYGVLHIVFNMYALVYIGPPLEAVLGHLRYAVLYFAAGLGGSVAAYAFGPVGASSAGASGAIFGLFGAYLVIARHQRRDTRVITGLIVVNLVVTFAVPGIDVRAHIGGLITGAAIAAVFAYAPAGRHRSATQLLGAAAVALILVGVTAIRTHQVRQEFAPPQSGAARAAAPAGISSADEPP